MMFKWLNLFLLAGATIFAVNCADKRLVGGTDTETAIVAGTITNMGKAVDGAVVTIDGDNSLQDVTDSAGKFSISGVKFGSHNIYASDGSFAFSGSFNADEKNENIGELKLIQTPPAKR